MLLRLRLRHLVLATWAVAAEADARVLPPGLEPAEVDGERIVSIVAFRAVGGRLGVLPVPPFSQLNVRLYATRDGEPAVYFLRSYVTAFGMAGTLLGAPYRPAWLRVRRGEVRGLGVDLRYRVDETAEARPGQLGRHELGIFEGIGLRAIRVRRGPADWRPAEPTREPRTDLLAALGLDVAGRPKVIYAPEASFETEVPAPRLEDEAPLSGPSSSASRSRR